MSFEDNHLVPVLYGEQNSHLHKIENSLGVQITNRGNKIIIKGDKAISARNILKALWARLEKGETITSHTVESALRFLEEERHKKSNNDPNNSLQGFSDSHVQISTKKKEIRPRSPLQATYIQEMKDNKLVFALGAAGTGKTYLAVAMAVSMLDSGIVERIILSRPAVEAGESLGFLPGELKEKMDPYMRPLYDALHDTMEADKIQKKLASEEIEIAPLAFMRGRTLNNAFVILDEAQNSTDVQMLMCLTRMGENTHMVVTGDPSQTDLSDNIRSGLLVATHTLAGIEDIAFINFTAKDVVRDKLVAEIIKAYEAKNKKGS